MALHIKKETEKEKQSKKKKNTTAPLSKPAILLPPYALDEQRDKSILFYSPCILDQASCHQAWRARLVGVTLFQNHYKNKKLPKGRQ